MNSNTEAAGDIAACKLVCTNINGSSGDGVLYDAGVSRGSSKYCQFDTAQPTVAYYCGGYSFYNNEPTATLKCKILYGAHDPAINSTDSGDAGNSKCQSLSPSTQLGEFQAL